MKKTPLRTLLNLIKVFVWKEERIIATFIYFNVYYFQPQISVYIDIFFIFIF